MVQFYPWFKFYFLLFLGMVMYGNEFETKENKIQTKDKIEPQHIHSFFPIRIYFIIMKINSKNILGIIPRLRI